MTAELREDVLFESERTRVVRVQHRDQARTFISKEPRDRARPNGYATS